MMPAVIEIAIGLAEKAQRFLTNPGQVAAMGTFLLALVAWAIGGRVANNRWPTLGRRLAGVSALPSTEPGSMS